MNKNARSSTLPIRGWYLFAAACAGGCLYQLASTGERSLNAVFLGYSGSRLLMMGVLLLAGIAGIVGFCSARAQSAVNAAASKRSVHILCAALFLALSLGWIVCGFMSEADFRPYFERIEPLLVFGMLVTASGYLLLKYLNRSGSPVGSESSAVRRTAFLYLLGALALYLCIRVTGVGIVPDEMDWQPTGVVIRYWEIWLSIWLALAVTGFMKLIKAERHKTLTTVILFFVIWAAAAVLYVSIPTMEVLKGSYFMEITAPDYLPFPASDSANFGLWAETILAGLGFKTAIAYRQFLITVIAVFEALTSRDILKTIDLVTITLALFPAVLYLLGKRLHSHGAGILAAGLCALREYNTILLAPHFMVSSAKMWLSDIPAALCLAAAVCACVNWFQKPRSVWRMLLAGFLMGLCVTVRSQFIALIVFPAIFFLLRKGLPAKEKWLRAAAFMLAVVFVIAPWFIRSKVITGDFILDDPGVHSTELARRWSDDVNNVVSREPGETDAEYAARNKQHMIDFFLEKPLYVTKFIMSHFFANELVAMTALPFGTDASLTINDYTNTDYHDVEGRLCLPKNIPVLFIFLAVIALGMGAAWKRAGWAGLLPFFLCSLYLGSTAAARYSGWRFALPGDWFYYFYFALGLAEIAVQVSLSFGASRETLLSVPALDTSSQPRRLPVCAALTALFLVLGAAPALSGAVVPQQVWDGTSAENAAAVEALTGDEAIAELLADPEKEVITGRIIYPRFFWAGEGLASGHPWIAYKIRDFTRLGFVLLNETNHDVILPLTEEPDFIENAADAYVIGEDDEDGYFRADAVIIPTENAAPRILWAAGQE